MPELRLVVLALQDKLAYGTTFQAALASLFGGEASSLNAAAGTQATTSPAPNSTQLATDLHALIADANKDIQDYQRLTAAGKLAEAGQKLDSLKGVLSRLQAHGR
jgi:uncharacterized membrane protein (UPF0182 family)